ncbi:hypothetical protein GCM10020220_020560 [Nonomuraea rubra]
MWSPDQERALAVARRLRTGQVSVNFNPVAPFGGYKGSGIGREKGRYGLEEFTEHPNADQWGYFMTTGADQVAAALDTLGVRHVFAIAGIHNLPILRALRVWGGIRIVGMRHEQTAVHAADGYARTTGTFGVALVSTGSGTAKAMAGLYEASFASSRVLLITGQVESAHLGRGRGYIHEADSRPDMLRAVCRTVARARRAGDLGAEVIRLARDVLTGRRRRGRGSHRRADPARRGRSGAGGHLPRGPRRAGRGPPAVPGRLPRRAVRAGLVSGSPVCTARELSIESPSPPNSSAARARAVIGDTAVDAAYGVRICGPGTLAG